MATSGEISWPPVERNRWPLTPRRGARLFGLLVPADALAPFHLAPLARGQGFVEPGYTIVPRVRLSGCELEGAKQLAQLGEQRRTVCSSPQLLGDRRDTPQVGP